MKNLNMNNSQKYKISNCRKTGNFVLIAIFLLFLISCNNLFGKKPVNEAETTVTLTGSFAIDISEGVSSYLENLMGNTTGDARTANPVMPSTMYYTVSAIQTNSAINPSPIIDGTVTGTDTSATFTINLKASSTGNIYTINAYAWKNRTGVEGSYTYSGLMFSGVLTDITLTDENPYKDDLKLTMNPTFYGDDGISAGEGTVNLPVYLEAASTITSAEATWVEGIGDNQLEKQQTLTFDANKKANFTMISLLDQADGVTTVPAGVYNVDFYFYKGNVNAAVKQLAYMCTETVIVYNSLETDTWQNSYAEEAPYFNDIDTDGNLELYVTNELAKAYESNTIFVKSDGNDTNNGSLFYPFNTIEKALSVINEQNDGSSRYSIMLLSDITDSSEQSYTAGNNAFVDINPTKKLKLSISSYGSPAAPYKINAARTASKTGRVVYIGNNANLTLKDIEITGGCFDSAGAGIALSTNGKLGISGVVKIDTNTKEDGSSMNNLYLDEDNYGNQKKINIEGVITGSSIYVKCEKESSIHNGSPLVFTSDYSSLNSVNPNDIFKSESGCYMGLSGGAVGIFISGGSVNVQINEVYEIKCLTSMIINPGSCDLSGRTVKFYLYNKTTGEDLTNTAVWNINAKYQEADLSDNYASSSGNAVVFTDKLENGECNIVAQANINGTMISTTHNVEIVEMELANTFESIPEANSVISIATQTDLNMLEDWINYSMSSTKTLTFVLQQDMEIENFESLGTGSGYNASKSYTGKFDGNGHTITIRSFKSDSYYSLFTGISGGTICNLILEGDIANAPGNTAAFSMASTNAVIENCINRVNITGTSDADGVAGFIHNGSFTIRNCRNEGNISGKQRVAGFSGYSYSGGCKFINCVNTGTITSTRSWCGGIYGYSGENYFINCINTGNVTGGNTVGGITAYAVNSNGNSNGVYNCRNSGTVTGSSSVGGIAGIVGLGEKSGLIENCVNTGNITKNSSNTTFGQIAGNVKNNSIVKNNFYLNRTGNTINGLGASSSEEPDTDINKTAPFTVVNSKSYVATPILVSGDALTDVVDLLNAWIDEQVNSEDYSRWVYDNTGLPKMCWEE